MFVAQSRARDEKCVGSAAPGTSSRRDCRDGYLYIVTAQALYTVERYSVQKCTVVEGGRTASRLSAEREPSETCRL